MSHHNPVVIANFFIDKTLPEGIDFLKLMKLCYLAHSFKLGLGFGPLSNEPVEAWQYGPVFQAVYSRFRGVFPEKVKNPVWTETSMDYSEKKICETVFDIYGDLQGWELIALTHKKGTPWYERFYLQEGYKQSHATISNEKIEEYYKKFISNCGFTKDMFND